MPLIGLMKQCGQRRDEGEFRGETAVAGGAMELGMLMLGRKTRAR